MKHYLLVLYGGIEICLHGPFNDEASRLTYAKKIRAASDDDAVFKMDINKESIKVDSFLASEVDPTFQTNPS